MGKSPVDISPGDYIFICQTRQYYRVRDVRFFREGFNATFTPNQVRSNLEFQNLASSEMELYFWSFIEINRNVRLNSITYNGEYLLGTKGDANSRLTIDHFPLGCPFTLFQWLHVSKVFMEIQEMAGRTLTTEFCLFASGLRVTLEDVPDNEKQKAVDNAIWIKG